MEPSDHALFLSVKSTYEFIIARGCHMNVTCSYNIIGRQYAASPTDCPAIMLFSIYLFMHFFIYFLPAGLRMTRRDVKANDWTVQQEWSTVQQYLTTS